MTEPLAVSPFLVGDPMVTTGPLYRRATTMTLSGIVASQVGNVFACRTDRESIVRVGLFSNPHVFAGVVAEVGLLMALILVEPISAVFNTAPLSFSEWGLLLLFPPAMLLLEEGRKWLVRIGVGRRERSRQRSMMATGVSETASPLTAKEASHES